MRAPPPDSRVSLGAANHVNVEGLLDALAESVAERVIAAVGEQQAPVAEPGKLAVSVADAAEQLGMSTDHFRRHVMPDLRVVRSGRLRLVSVAELRDWLDRSAARALDGARLAHDVEKPHHKRDRNGAQGDAPWGDDERVAA